MSDELKMVILARKDLKLSKGKMSAQVAHAAVMLAHRRRTKDEQRTYNRWYGEAGQRKVVLFVAGEAELLGFQATARAADLPTALVRDAGHTEIPAGTLTVLGIGPAPDAVLDPLTGHLKLAFFRQPMPLKRWYH